MGRRARSVIVGFVIGAAIGAMRSLFDDPSTASHVPQTQAGWVAYYVSFALPFAFVGAAVGFLIGRRRAGS